MPAERVEENDLAMVSSEDHAHHEQQHHDEQAQEQEEAEAQPEYDDPGLMDDLQLLSLPPEGEALGDAAVDPLDDLPIEHESPEDQEGEEGEEPAERASHPLPLVTKSWTGRSAPTPSEEGDALDEMLRDEAPPQQVGQRNLPSEDLVLDAFDDEPRPQRPVVLLGDRQRKTNRPPEDEAHKAGPRSGEYMSDLERRLEEGDDDR